MARLCAIENEEDALFSRRYRVGIPGRHLYRRYTVIAAPSNVLFFPVLSLQSTAGTGGQTVQARQVLMLSTLQLGGFRYDSSRVQGSLQEAGIKRNPQIVFHSVPKEGRGQN